MTDPPPNSVSLAAMWAVTLPSPHPTSSIFSPPESMQWAKNVALASLINIKLLKGSHRVPSNLIPTCTGAQSLQHKWRRSTAFVPPCVLRRNCPPDLDLVKGKNLLEFQYVR